MKSDLADHKVNTQAAQSASLGKQYCLAATYAERYAQNRHFLGIARSAGGRLG